MRSGQESFVYAVLGAGRQGTAAGYDLALHGGASRVLLADRDEGVAMGAAARINALLARPLCQGVRVDGSRPDELRRLLSDCSAVLCALPYTLNPGVASVAVQTGCHFCDLGGNTEISRQVLLLGDEAARSRVSLVPDCGLAPGLGSTLTALALTRLATADTVRVRCGGLPVHPRPPLGYKLVFHIGGLTNEYMGEAEVIRNGRLMRIPTLEEVETLDLPDGLGRAEAFPTSGGTSTMCETYMGKLRELDYKTVRYPGHVAVIRAVRDLGLLDERPVRVGEATVRPREVFHAVAAPHLDFPDDPDLVFLRVEAEGRREGGLVRLRFEILDYADQATGFLAMERMTGFPAACILAQQARGIVPPGAHPVELASPPGSWPDELKRRGIRLQEEQTELD